MEQLTNKEIARVFTMYSESLVVEEGGNSGHNLGVVKFGDRYQLYTNCSSNDPYFSSLDLHKLALRPLSLITDEDAIEVSKIITRNIVAYDNIDSFKYWLQENINTHKICWQAYQYLIHKSYSVPLYFSPNHWANGKTAIELGIAISNQ